MPLTRRAVGNWVEGLGLWGIRDNLEQEMEGKITFGLTGEATKTPAWMNMPNEP